MDLRSQDQLLDEYTEGSRRQFSRLLNMERRELQSQKEVSDAWVKYIYLLLEVTMERCKKEDTLFYNLDEFGQTMLLREEANKLRAQSGIAPYEVIYDPLDAAEIVRKFTSLPIGESLGLSKPAEKLSVELDTKYGKLLKSVPVSKIIIISIFTIAIFKAITNLFTNLFTITIDIFIYFRHFVVLLRSLTWRSRLYARTCRLRHPLPTNCVRLRAKPSKRWLHNCV